MSERAYQAIAIMRRQLFEPLCEAATLINKRLKEYEAVEGGVWKTLVREEFERLLKQYEAEEACPAQREVYIKLESQAEENVEKRIEESR